MSVRRDLIKAKKLVQSKDIAGARTVLNGILNRFPGNAEAKVLLARLPSGAGFEDLAGAFQKALGAGDRAGALRLAKAMVDARPDVPETWNNLGAMEAQENNHRRAAEAFEKALSLRSDYARARLNLGVALIDQGDAAAAAPHLERAVQEVPDNANAWRALGQARRYAGDRAGAIVAQQRALDLDPDLVEAHLSLSHILTYTKDEPHLAALEGALDRAKGDVARMHLHFALGKARDDLGQIDAAFSHFETANAFRKAELGYDISQDATLFETIKSVFKDPPIPFFGHALVRPVFILGLPRSGTTLVETILAAHPDVAAGGELPHLSPLASAIKAGQMPDLADLRAQYLDAIARIAGGSKVVTDKTPLNFRLIGLIATALPEAKILHVTRDPRAVLWSSYRRNLQGAANAFSTDLQASADYFALYRDLMAFWHDLFPGKITDIAYADLAADPETETRTIVDAAGLDWSPACLEPHAVRRTVQTASADQVRVPISAGRDEAWQAYARHLRPLLEGLESLN